MLRKHTLIIFLFATIAIGGSLIDATEKSMTPPPVSMPDAAPDIGTEKPNESPQSQMVPLPQEELRSSPKEVPFLVQAPSGEWSDPHFQNACEEASLIMVARWRRNVSVTKEEGKDEILKIERFEEKKFGTFIDTSVEDTQKVLDEYYGINNSQIERDIEIKDIIQALQRGNVVIVPADGRKLKNPHFRQPGPPRHMLVVTGYDKGKKEFITNDPGTKNGKNYHYKENVLYEAILDYPTGDHIPAKSDRKVMLIIPGEIN